MAGTGRFGLASVLLGLWLLVSCTTPSRPVADPAGAPRVVEFVIGPNVDAPFDPNDPKWTRVSNPEIIEATMRRLVEDPVGDYPHLLLFRALQMVSLDRHGQVVDGYIFDGSAKARAPVIRAGALERVGGGAHVKFDPDDLFLERGIVVPELNAYRRVNLGRADRAPLAPPGGVAPQSLISP